MTCTPECRTPTRTQAHCSACHRTFTAVTWFDIHRIGGRCNDIPGLVEKDGLWATQERHEWNVVMRERLKQIYRQRPT